MFVYIIQCTDNSLYTGIAKDIIKRLTEHMMQTKTCAKYTKVHKMDKLVALWKTDTRSNASKLEYKIKQLSHEDKCKIINCPSLLYEFVNSINCKNYINLHCDNINNEIKKAL